jgi:hypothetical protein
MKVISYDDFLLVEKYMGPDFEILLEKNLTNEIDKKLRKLNLFQGDLYEKELSR